jgi:LmbE family N-acetylglucosaminyl deacetylase
MGEVEGMRTTPNRRTALAFVAHPDDAEFLCAGTLVRLASAGWEVHIATVANGDCGTMTESCEAIAARRALEAAEAAALIGATYHCLGESDIFVVYDKPTLHKSVDLLRRVAPQLVFTHSPADYMMDHVVVSQLARAASFAYGAPNASTLPLREGSGVPHLYYCDPLDGIDPHGKRVMPTAWVDIGQQLDKKAEMLACHRSQRDWLRAHHGTDEYLDAMRRHAVMRGNQIGVAAAEAFVQHLGHAYPKTNILAELPTNV